MHHHEREIPRYARNDTKIYSSIYENSESKNDAFKTSRGQTRDSLWRGCLANKIAATRITHSMVSFCREATRENKAISTVASTLALKCVLKICAACFDDV